jgi:hypothetical protein
LFPASLPSGLPQNPNVLLIRTHPNPSPSVANNNKLKQTERGDYILSEKILEQNQNCQCFGLFWFELKEKKNILQDTLITAL